MSKERDLLKRWFSEFGRICCNKNLLIETKELLAKPEPEQVAWEKEKKSYLDEIDRLGVESNRDEEEIDRLTQLLTPTKQKPVAWMYDWEDKIEQEQMQDRITKIKSMTESPEAFNVRPLYLAPPTRKPLSDKDIGKGFLQIGVWHRYGSFIAGVRWAEQQHNITGGSDDK
jgi:hypothetical protein